MSADLPTATHPPADPDRTGTAGPGHTPAPPPAAGTVLAGRYRLLRPLGQGGMGMVFLAEQTDPVRREVAVKLIRAGRESAAILARFEAERQALALMTHPHIARIFDGGTAPDGSPFVVMEYVPGEPITDHARALPLPDRLRLFVAVCEAVQHAHQKGVIHRDLKPSNVLVAEMDGQPTPKVIDFGIAKATGGRLTDAAFETTVGSIVGTPAYMAPEQAGANPEDVDTRADVYALGVLLYELLTGTTPISRETLKNTPLLEVLRMVREDDPPPPSRRAAGLTRELDWVVMRALAKERDRRYGSAAALAADVRRFLANEPVEAGPPSRWYRGRKFVRRNRIPVAAAAVVVLALLGGIAGTTWGMVRANEETRRKEEARQEAAASSLQAQESEKARAKELGRTAALAAELAARQGKWEEAIRLYDQALAQDPADEIGLKLGRLGCRLALLRFREVRADLDELAARPDLGRYRGRVLLEQAEASLYVADYGDPRDLARQALAAGLAPADAAYARVFLADTVPDAIVHLREAVRLDPFHRSGSQMLASLLFANGHLDEMREVVAALRASRPDSVGALQMEAILRAVDGDRAGVERAFARMAELGAGVGARSMRAVVELIAVGRDEWFLVKGLRTDRAVGLLKDWQSIGPALAGLVGDPDPDKRKLTDLAFFRLPLFRALGDLPIFREGVANPLALVLILSQPARMIELFEPIVRAIPEGVFLMIYAAYLDQAGRRVEAEAAYRRALDAPSWANHRKAARFRLMLVQYTLALDRRTPNPDRAAWQDKALAHARVLAASGPLPSDVADAVVMVARSGGDYALALALAEAAVRDYPDKVGHRIDKAQAEYRLGAWARAEATAREALDKFNPPLDQVRMALGILESVAVSYRNDGQWPNAERVLRFILAKRGSAFGPDSADTLLIREYLADGYLTAGQPERGLPLLRETLAGHRRALTRDPVGLASELARTGSNLLRHGHPAEAEPILREALALREKHLAPANWAVASAKSLLGGALAGQKRFAEAEPLLLAGYAGLTDPRAELIPAAQGNVELSVRRLVDLYTAWGKPAEAAKWQAKLPPEQAPPPRMGVK